MRFTLAIILLSSTFYSSAQNRMYYKSRSDFNVRGNVRWITETRVTSDGESSKKDPFQDTIYSIQYYFEPDGTFDAKRDTPVRSNTVICYQSLDSTEYHITQDTITGFERAEKMTVDSIDYEIRYRKYNDQGYLILDSARLRAYLEPHTFEGWIARHYEYDPFGNVTYHQWKSYFVFALKGWKYYIYKFDDFGNWIERRAYIIHKSDLKSEKKLVRKNTPESITYRVINYR